MSNSYDHKSTIDTKTDSNTDLTFKWSIWWSDYSAPQVGHITLVKYLYFNGGLFGLQKGLELL